MKIKGLYKSSLINYFVVQLSDSKFYIFYETPFRAICEKDLLREVYKKLDEKTALKYLKPAERCFLKFYGLEIV